MRRRFPRSFALLVATLVAVPAAQAADKACLVEGSFTLGNESTPTRGCTENTGLPPAAFKEMCEGGVKMASGLPGAKPAKLTYSAACPAKAQGVCHGLFGQPLSGYYYDLDAEWLARTRKVCEAKGGKFKLNP
ncbi:MAG: hypothetical protein EOP39_06060 [Rubrivivax sp.]|nr:MAG: hypothetical protein EOP39_06060 [Rubrivivax sp.]